MIRVSDIRLPVGHSDAQFLKKLGSILGIRPDAVRDSRIHKRAIDARGSSPVAFRYTVDVQVSREDEEKILVKPRLPSSIRRTPDESYQAPSITEAKRGQGRPVIVGAGPCGLFATLLLARSGLEPLLLERGKPAGDRARDVTGFWRRGTAFDQESNVQFGEGGAGTFSDGKLYTQIRDPEYRIPWLLRELVAAGAPEDILSKARPHIGTDRLITVIRHLRGEILSLGGEIRFQTPLTDLRSENGKLVAVQAGDGWIKTDTCILALGHSARDTFFKLHAAGIHFEPKPFSVGVRIEHPQEFIDKAQYGAGAGHPLLGAAPYKFAAKARTGRTAYSFCMCPGGLVVAAPSEAGMVVTNGMSSYARAEANANAGFMVEVKPEEIGATPETPLAGIDYQRRLEQRAYELGGSNYRAPAQLLGDFLARRPSSGPASVAPSYQPGVTWGDLRDCLPESVSETLQSAVKKIARQLRGFDLPDAVMTGVETRSSSPVRIPRDARTLECLSLRGLYPAGEGAGYAGGIISAAADGLRVAEAILEGKVTGSD